jgi:hypothetical protein
MTPNIFNPHGKIRDQAFWVVVGGPCISCISKVAVLHAPPNQQLLNVALMPVIPDNEDIQVTPPILHPFLSFAIVVTIVAFTSTSIIWTLP